MSDIWKCKTVEGVAVVWNLWEGMLVWECTIFSLERTLIWKDLYVMTQLGWFTQDVSPPWEWRVFWGEERGSETRSQDVSVGVHLLCAHKCLACSALIHLLFFWHWLSHVSNDWMSSLEVWTLVSEKWRGALCWMLHENRRHCSWAPECWSNNIFQVFFIPRGNDDF